MKAVQPQTFPHALASWMLKQATVVPQDNTVYFIGLTVQSSCTTCSTAVTIRMLHAFTRQHVIPVSDDIITPSFVMSIRLTIPELLPCMCVFVYIYIYVYAHTHTDTHIILQQKRVYATSKFCRRQAGLKNNKA